MRTIVNIDVPELKPAIDFYSAALGLRLGRRIGDDVAELVGASTMICLLENRAGSRPVPGHDFARDYARHWTPVHLDFVVDDVAQAAQRALTAGAIQEGECMEWMGARWITFADPFGHGFCVIEFSPGSYGA